MIVIVVFAIGVYGAIIYASPPAISSQNERIYLHSSLNSGSSDGYVKVSDLSPNSSGYFMYPSSYNFSDNANAYQRFVLIRLPSWMGGDRNDISSYRAYSMLDLDSHCMIKYWSQGERQNIQDPCHFEMYRIIDGASDFFGMKAMSKPVENALPQLDLGVDDSGYIYVKTPTWDVNKNGVVGDGRHLSKDQVLNSSRLLLEKYESQSKINIPIPFFLEDGSFLVDISYDNHEAYIRYTFDKPTISTPSIDILYCNCTELSTDGSRYYYGTNHIQAWQFGNHTVYSYDMSTSDQNNPSDLHTFEFYQDRYHVIFNPVMSFDQGMKATLDTFFNGTKLSDIEQVSIEK